MSTTIKCLSNFECPSQNVQWELLEPNNNNTYKRLIGSGKTLFQFFTNHGEFEVDERNIMVWDKEDDEVIFQALVQVKTEWLVLTLSSNELKNHDGTTYEVYDIKVIDCRGKHKTFSNFMESEKFLRTQAKRIKHLAKIHKLNVGYFYYCDESDDESDESSFEFYEQITQEPKSVENEVELKEMTDDEIAIMMQKEIHDEMCYFHLDTLVSKHIKKLDEHVENKAFEDAIDIARVIRSMLSGCKYRKGVGEELTKLHRGIVGDDLSHVTMFEQMESLKRTHKYLKINLIPTTLSGNNETLVQSRQNILYVTKTVYEQILRIHELLEKLVDASSKMRKGKQIQLGFTFKKISKLYFIPNQIIYNIRGFQNLNMVVNVW